MCSQVYIFLFIFSLNSVICQDDNSNATNKDMVQEEEQKLSELIINIIEHFKDPDPVGLPGANIPDPYFVPDMKKFLALGGSIEFKNTALYGLSQFRLPYANIEANKMEATTVLTIDKVHAKGNYILKTWLNTYSGHYTSDVHGIHTSALASLGVDRDGKIRVQNIRMDINLTNIEVQFENSSIVAMVLQGLFNSLGTFLFENIKPYILKDAYTKITEEVNKKLDEVTEDLRFSSTISPIDMVLINARNKVISLKKDPLYIQDYHTSASIFKIALENTHLTGISSFYRVGEPTLKMENNTVIVDFQISTQKIQGSTQWRITTYKEFKYNRSGSVQFLVNYIKVQLVLGQPLDMRKRPQFRKLAVEVGNIQVRFDGAGTIDYIVELAVNILPNLVRNQIIKAFEESIRSKIQDELNEIDLEQLILEFLPIVDKLQLKGLKLNEMFPDTSEIIYDEDDFFNF